MITDSEPSRPQRTLRIALVLSLLVHATGAAVYGVQRPVASLLRARSAHPSPEAFVTISDSFRIDKKAVVPPKQHRAIAHHAARRTPPERLSRPDVAVVPQPRHVARRPTTVPPPPHRLRHELAKYDPRAKSQAARTVAAIPPPETRPEPTVPPQKHVVPPKPLPTAERVAEAEPIHPPHPVRPVRASARLSPEQIAQIDNDLEKTIAQTRAEENPLRVPKTAAAAPRRYKMSVDSVHVGSLRSGEGTYWPIAAGRHEADGYTYYHCAYAYQWADGTFERGVVPWLVRFAPSEDPILHPELSSGGPIGLPPPPPGFQLAAGMHVGRALRGYFPGVAFANE